VELTEETITEILKNVLYEFPVKEIAFTMPKWVNQLEKDHWLQASLYSNIQEYAESIEKIKDISDKGTVWCEYLKTSKVTGIDLGTGSIKIELTLEKDIFYKVLGETTGLEICDEASLMPCVINLAKIKKEYAKISSALEQVEATGYGIVMPTIGEMTLEEPEIVRQGGRYGVRLRASSPSIHLMKATITTEVSPIVGTEHQSQELVMSLLNDFEENPIKIWESNIFGKSLHELVNEGLQNKLTHMPSEARGKLQETLERVINEGCSGLICIIL
ncbi:MAG: stage IV sporulation protein A, partial [Oscillospiraceae bacterium]